MLMIHGEMLMVSFFTLRFEVTTYGNLSFTAVLGEETTDIERIFFAYKHCLNNQLQLDSNKTFFQKSRYSV